MEYTEFLRKVPKVELHCHLEGTVRASTFADQARKHGIELPTQDVDKLYDYDTIYEFLKIFQLVSSTLIDREDFARVAYETLEDGVKLGKGKEYVSMAMKIKGYTEKQAGFADGIRADIDGNIWVGAGWVGEGYDGVHVYAPDGTRIGQILLPEICSNVCFGGAKRNRLFMTGSQSLYAVYVETQGAHIS